MDGVTTPAAPAAPAAPSKPDEKGDSEDAHTQLLQEARERFARCEEAENDNRTRALEAIKFRALEQWPDKLKSARENNLDGAQPCLVLDKTNQIVNQVVNDNRQNRPSIKVRPVDERADLKVAEAYQGMIRHIEVSSDADIAYDTALEHSADGGFGYVRVITEYEHPRSFQQCIKIRRVRNRFCVMLDPDRQQPDGSDARYGFVYEKISRAEFRRQYPGKPEGNFETDGKQFAGWCDKDSLIVAEYFYVEPEDTEILLLASGEVVTTAEYERMEQRLQSAMQIPEAGKALPEVIDRRTSQVNKVRWAKITATDVLEERDWPGKYIPIAECVGTEIDIEGRSKKFGLVEPAMDGQRMHNYAISAFVEQVALAPRAPWVAEEGQIEGHENKYKAANRKNIAVLPYKARVEGGVLIPPPQRAQMPGIPTGWLQTMTVGEEAIYGSTGVYRANLGAPSNESSGRAILARQREGDVGTFHYADNQARMIRHVGRILVDLIPRIYNRATVARILGEDGAEGTARIDPTQREAVRQARTPDGVTAEIFNLNVGTYDVTVSAGPSYTTKRQEAADTLMQVTQGNPQMMGTVGDLMFRAMDFPYADEIADRLKKLLPPQLQEGKDGKPQDPRLEQAMQMVEKLTAQVNQLTESAEAAKVRTEERKVEIDAYNAETNRLKVVGTALGPEQIQAIVISTMQSLLSTPDISTGAAPSPAIPEVPNATAPNDTSAGLPANHEPFLGSGPDPAVLAGRIQADEGDPAADGAGGPLA